MVNDLNRKSTINKIAQQTIPSAEPPPKSSEYFSAETSTESAPAIENNSETALLSDGSDSTFTTVSREQSTLAKTYLNSQLGALSSGLSSVTESSGVTRATQTKGISSKTGTAATFAVTGNTLSSSTNALINASSAETTTLSVTTSSVQNITSSTSSTTNNQSTTTTLATTSTPVSFYYTLLCFEILYFTGKILLFFNN